MPDTTGDNFQDRILAYHMGWLSRSDMAEVERLIETDEHWAEVSRTLEESIRPLPDWTTLPVVDNLEDQVLRHIDRQQGDGATDVTVRLSPVSDTRPRGGRWTFSIKELLATAASIAILLGIVMPVFGRASAKARQVACMNNLRQIGTAHASYTSDFEDWMPFASTVMTTSGNTDPRITPSSWLREKTSGINRLRNSRNRFLLLKQGYLADGDTFVCPADLDAVIMRYDSLAEFDDFPERYNCSYDSQIMTSGTRTTDTHPAMVVYSDSNPLFDEDASTAVVAANYNSKLHRQLGGQNVLRLDGSAGWTRSPNVGVENDNIWQIGARRNYTGSETPRFPTDSFLIP